MKVTFSLLFMVFFTLFSQAQFSDLGSLSEGRLVNFQPIMDNNEELYGYFVNYTLDNVNSETKKFESIFLDKNLNKVSSKEYTANSLVQYYSAYINDIDQFILRPRYQVNTKKDLKLNVPTSLILDMKNDTIIPKIYQCYQKDHFEDCDTYEKSFKELSKEQDDERKRNGYVYDSQVRQLKDGGYLVYDFKDMGKNENKSFLADNRFMRFDADKNKVWEYNFNENADKKNTEYFYLIEWDDDYAFFLRQVKAKNDYTYYLVAMDVQEGKKAKEVNLKDIYGHFTPSQLFYLDNQGIDNTYSDESTFKILALNFNDNFTIQEGYTLHVFDKKTQKFSEEWMSYEDMKSFIPVKKSGIIDGKYKLYERDVYFLKGGAVGILNEKAYMKGSGKLVTTDLVMINTDDSFKPKEIVTLEKDKSKNFNANDYLFSQYLNDKKDVVFFYRDYQKDDETKDKNWQLYINTIIDGNFKQENIQISSKDNFIYPFIAKEGYILLRELNKNEKYDQIRLERLNF